MTGAVKLKRQLGQEACDWNHCVMHDLWNVCLHTHFSFTALLLFKSLSWQMEHEHCKFVWVGKVTWVAKLGVGTWPMS